MLRETYGGFEDIDGFATRQMVVSSDNSLAAFAGEEALAFASLHRLADVVELRNLAVNPQHPEALEALLRHILSQATIAPREKHLRIVALGEPSIMEAVTPLGFRPRRRILKVKWLTAPTLTLT